MLYKEIEDGIIIRIGKSNRIHHNSVEISQEEYYALDTLIDNKPTDTLEFIYRLSAETQKYEPYPRTHEETVAWYVEKVNSGEMTIDEVSTDYKEEVEQLVTPSEEPDLYQQGYEQALIDLAETTGGIE